MMELYQVVLLAVLQGVTEFLPISSSAHLVIPSLVLNWPDQGLAFDVAVHVGTLLAVILYFRVDLLRMSNAWLRSLGGGTANEDSRMVWYLGFATIPAGLVGLLAGDYIEVHLRTLPVIATTTLVFGIILGMAERRAIPVELGKPLSFSLAMLIGAAQAVAPVPGVSRSGITITAALFLGLSRQAAAKFSFLLSIPIIISAGALLTWELAAGDAIINLRSLALGVLISCVSAYACIAAFLRLLDRVGLMPFVYYRVGLSVVLYLLWLA